MSNSKLKKIFAVALLFAVIGMVSILNVSFVKAVDFSAPSIIVSLASSSPSSQIIEAGSTNVPLLSFKISNTYNREVNVTNISISMTGTATPDDVTKVYLFEGTNLLGSSGFGRGGSGYNFTSFGTDSQSCYPKCPSFVLIPANSSKVITVKADIASTLSANQITSSLSSSLFTAERLPVSGVPVVGSMTTIIATVMPDLVVKNIKFDPSPAIVNKKTTMSFEILNQGNGAVFKNITTEINHPEASLVRTISDTCNVNGQLPVNQKCIVSLELLYSSVSPSGILYSGSIKADRDNSILESNEINNTTFFTIAVASTTPSITVLSPNGGTLEAGKTYIVSWQSENAPTGAWVGVVRLFKNNGTQFLYDIVPSFSKNSVSGSVQWNIPVNSVLGNDFKIQVILNTGSAGSESNIAQSWSDAPFSIVSSGGVATSSPSITVLSPNGGERWLHGQSYNIRWSAPDGYFVGIFASPSLSGAEEYPDIIVNSGYTQIKSPFNWTVPNTIIPGDYKIKIQLVKSDADGSLEFVREDRSDAPFSIVATNASVISEQVKCVFNGSQYEQKCYAASRDNDNISCSGKENCVTDIKRAKSESVTWKSTCGGYAYTTMDGKNELAEFDCTAKAATSSNKPIESKVEIIDMKYKAKDMVDDKYDAILSELKQLRDIIKEQQNEIKYLKSMTDDLRNISDQMKSAINDFITYGVDSNTVKLGAGERAAVINSYKSAFDKLPETEAELTDVIKIANGRFPSLISERGEKEAKEQFIKIYKRIADMNNVNDSAAIKVMAYGLRQKAENRNLNSEKSGIKIFQNIYGRTPKTTEDWNTMQAITYSGATR